MAVGITADSFIVFFERIRDEMRGGKSMRVAVEAGWVRARGTCLAADSVSLLAAVVLYVFAAGVVKGFAFALGLSTLIDIAVFFWFTHPMVTLLARYPFFNKGHRLSGLDAESARARYASRPEGGPDEQVHPSGQRPLLRRAARSTSSAAAASGTRLGRDHHRRRSWGSTFKGLNFGHRVPGRRRSSRSRSRSREATQANADKLSDAVAGTGIDAAQQVVVTTAGRNNILVETEPLTPVESNQISSTIQETLGITKADVSVDDDRPELGQGGRQTVVIGLIVFLVLVVLFIWAYFRSGRWRWRRSSP